MIAFVKCEKCNINRNSARCVAERKEKGLIQTGKGCGYRSCEAMAKSKGRP